MTEDFNIPKAIYLYYKEGIKDLDFKKIKNFIKDNFGNIKINLIRLKKEAIKTKGLLFDFIATQQAFDQAERSLSQGKSTFTKDIKDSCHIIISDKLFATLDQDNRPHIRTSIYSFPSVISTSGIVEGPAKPREYYILKQKYSQLGIWGIEEQEVKQKFKGRFIDYGDTRLTEVVNGYIAQAIFFYMTGEPFCKNKNCWLFNAHWQEDLIYSQIKSSKFCTVHKKTLGDIKDFS